MHIEREKLIWFLAFKIGSQDSFRSFMRVGEKRKEREWFSNQRAKPRRSRAEKRRGLPVKGRRTNACTSFYSLLKSQQNTVKKVLKRHKSTRTNRIEAKPIATTFWKQKNRWMSGADLAETKLTFKLAVGKPSTNPICTAEPPPSSQRFGN